MQRKHRVIWSAPGGLPVYRQVYRRIRSEILSGRLAAGARLPSSRTLASELGVARGTVVTAFQMLAGEGSVHAERSLMWRSPAPGSQSPRQSQRKPVANL